MTSASIVMRWSIKAASISAGLTCLPRTYKVFFTIENVPVLVFGIFNVASAYFTVGSEGSNSRCWVLEILPLCKTIVYLNLSVSHFNHRSFTFSIYGLTRAVFRKRDGVSTIRYTSLRNIWLSHVNPGMKEIFFCSERWTELFYRQLMVSYSE